MSEQNAEGLRVPEPGAVYRWSEAGMTVIALPSSLAPGVVRVVSSHAARAVWSQDWVPDDAVLMVPADAGVDVPPGQPRVIIRDMPERLDLTNREHQRAFDRTLSDLVAAANGGERYTVGDPDLQHSVSRVRYAVGRLIRQTLDAQRMEEYRTAARELLTGTPDQRVERIAQLMREAADGPEDTEGDWQ